jgi:O-antigen ligase
MAALVVLGPRMNTISTEEASSYGRLEAWSLALDLWKSSPLFGVGYDNFMDYHFRTTHNSYLLCLSELGLFGLMPWLMLSITSYKNSRFVENELIAAGQRNFAMYVHAAYLGLVVFFAGALLLSRTYHPALFVLFGINAAISRVFVTQSDQKYVLFDRRDMVWGVVLTLASLVGMQVLMRLLW